MKRTEFLATIKGQEHAHLKRRLRILYLQIDQEPQTKAISSSDAGFFRRSVLKQLRKANRRPFKGDIVLEVNFFSTADAPQPLQTLVKNYLDLLHKAMPHVDRREKLIFNDDNQIKLLIANHYSGSKSPIIYIKAYRFSSFIKDAEYAQNILQNDFSDKNYFLKNGLDLETRLALNLDPSFGELIKDFYRLNKKESDSYSGIRLFSEDILRRQIHEAYIKQNEFPLESLLDYLQPLFAKNQVYKVDEKFQQLFKITRDYMLISLDFIPMGGAPIKKGELKPFRAHLQNQLKHFVADHPYLFPMLQPVGLTIVCVPPVYNAPDVDNLARQIVSFFDEICRPPLTHTSLPGVPTYRTGKVKISTSSYQILYLSRDADDPENGKILILLDNGLTSSTGFWAKVNKLIEKWEDHIKYKHY